MRVVNKIPETPHVFGTDTVTTTDLSKIFGFVVSWKFLNSIGCTPVGQTRRGYYWRKNDIPIISTAIQGHLQTVKRSYQ